MPRLSSVVYCCQEHGKPAAAAGQRVVDNAVDNDEDAHMTMMKNMGDQFGESEDESEEMERQVKIKSGKRPPDVVLEHANDTYTQRFCK